MCGIAGFVRNDSPSWSGRSRQIISGMVKLLRHRGPNSSGIWTNNDNTVALGHTRLSILDLTHTGHQPIESQDKKLIMSYNGEIYNYQSIAGDLKKEGVSLRGTSDTEVFIEAISRWGIEKVLSKVNGMFAFAIWNKNERTLRLGRDRFGKKPLYYGWQGGTFLFASELKAFKPHPDFRGEIDRVSLSSFFKHSYIPTPGCIYNGIKKLDAGSHAVISFSPKNVKYHNFYSIADDCSSKINQSTKTSDKEVVQMANAKLKSAVSLRMVSDVPVGAFLSGGIDSSLVVSHMCSISSTPPKTFTLGFQEKDFNEAKKAAKIAKYLGTEHTELYINSNDLIKYLPDLANIYDEPFSDVSQLPTYLICKLASESVSVCLSGDGGDELFCGYSRYLKAIKKWESIRRVPSALRKISSIVIKLLNSTFQKEEILRLSKFLDAKSCIEIYNFRNERISSADKLVLGCESEINDFECIETFCSQYSDLEKMMLLDISGWLMDDILVKLDRASMANSLEVRNPLLDPEFANFAKQLPIDFKLRDGESKWLLKKCLTNFLPQELIKGPKQGFAVPIRQWLRGPLRNWAEDMLNESKVGSEGFLDPKKVKAIWNSFLQGNNRNRNAVWSMLMFQTWLDANN